ncbi:MAG: hypothetical protein JSV43_01475, partial [Methanobacteriota archaeon]
AFHSYGIAFILAATCSYVLNRKGGLRQVPRVPTTRKVRRDQVSWEKARKRRVLEDIPEPKKEKEEPLLPSWIRRKKAILVIFALFVILTVLGYFLGALRYVLIGVGIGMMIVSYFVGGGFSEVYGPMIPRLTTRGAKAEMDYRYKRGASDWTIIMGGILIGGVIFLSGVFAIFLDGLF